MPSPCLPGSTAASSLWPFLLVSSVACGPLNGLRGRVIATLGRGDLASSTFRVQAPHLCVRRGIAEKRGAGR